MAVAAFLWTKEVNEVCNALDVAQQPPVTISVNKRFNDVLKIWWSYALIDFFRSLIALIAISSKSRVFGWIYQVLIVNDIFGIGAVLILHSYRFQQSG